MQSIDYIPGSDGAANASLMTVSTVRAPLASTILVNTVANVPDKFFGSMGTPNTFIDPITGETITVISEATAVDFAGHVDGSNIEIDAIAPGYTDIGSAVGDIIIIRPITEWANNIHNILAAEHKDDGKHGDVTVDSILVNTTNQNLSNQNLYANAIINGGCMVAQRVTAPNLSTTSQYGKVDRFRVHATGTAVNAGTINQNTSSLVAAEKGYELKVAGATITGTGVVIIRHRIEAKDALAFVNQAASFGVKIYHDVGSAVNATVYIRKADAADDFTTTTNIANSGAVSIPNTTRTALKFENINTGNLGNVANGIEIEIQIACGAVTTKNFSLGEFVFNLGAKAAPYLPVAFEEELRRCQRYYEKSQDYTVAPGAGGITQVLQHNSYNSGNTISNTAVFKVTKRTVPTVTVWDVNGNINKLNWIAGTGSSTANTNEPGKLVRDTGWQYTSGGMPATSNGTSLTSWQADAEL